MYKEYQFFTNNSRDQTFSLRASPYIDRFKVLRVTIPLSYNTTDSSNNALRYDRDGNKTTVRIPKGNYNASSFPAALQTALNNGSDNNWSVTYNEVDRSVTISGTNPFTIQPYEQGTTMYRMLGLSKYDVPSSGTSATFGIADLTNSAPLLLASSNLTSKDLSYVGDERINVLAMLDTSTPQNGVAHWINNGSYVFCGTEVSTVDFRGLNANTLLPVDLSQPFSVAIGCLTDPDDPVVAQ